jgi:hypothetical protein
MKVQATVLLAFQAKSLAEAGAVLDDVLARARERGDCRCRPRRAPQPAWRSGGDPSARFGATRLPATRPASGERRKRVAAIADRVGWRLSEGLAPPGGFALAH